jgi:hypothetical protein
MQDKQRKPGLTAAIALLILGISAGLGPGHHACHLSALPTASDHLQAITPVEPHGNEIAGVCEACLLTAQLNSLGLSAVAGVVPTPYSASHVREVQAPVSSLALPAHASRAPPLAILNVSAA